MNILLEFTTINYKMWHSMAKRLKEIYPGSRFAGIAGFNIGMECVLDYLKNQTDIKYEFLYLDHDIMAKAFESEIELDELRRFEEKLPGKSLWRLIAADRGLGSVFMHGVVQRKSFINQNNTYENILRFFSGMLRHLKIIFSDYKPDLFLPAIAMGGIAVFIYEQLCKDFRIPYIVPTNVRVKNLFAFSADTQLRFPQIDATYRQLMKGDLKLDLSKAEKLYNELMGEIENPQYFERINSRFNVVQYNTLYKKLRWLGSTVKAVLDEIIRWWFARAIRKSMDIRSQPDDLATFLNNISYTIQHMIQSLRITSPRFAGNPDVNKKYIYYPLHGNPEYSTQIQATMWLDQVYLIELLAKNIPVDWLVCVKEHPGTLVARTRPFFFHDRIRRIPNVRLVPVHSDMHTMISNAQMVAVITGTSGWEAVLRGKPCITFADTMWDVLELSRKCCNVETLSRDIFDEMQRMSVIPPDEKRRKLICFFAAILEHSFEISYPNQFVYTEPSTDEECEILGRETADTLKKHLEFLKKNSAISEKTN